MRLLLDMDLPPSMAEWLRSLGHDAIHVRELGFSDRSDREVFARAAAGSRVIVTFDVDFGEIAGLVRGTTVGAVLLRLRVTSQHHLRRRLAAAISVASVEAGAIVVAEDTRIRVRPRPFPAP